MKKRGAKRRDESNKHRMQIIKQCWMKNKTVVTAAWSDLDLDTLGEIKKKLYYADHIRFGGVCKTWLAAQHDKRADDVLPWLMVLTRPVHNKLCYNIYQPSAPHLDPAAISHTISLDKYFGDTSHLCLPISTIYVHGWLYVSIYNRSSCTSRFLLFSHATKSSFTLPLFNHPAPPFDMPLYFGFSASPSDPDCVFLALHVTDEYSWTIGIFRHGDTQWTTIHSAAYWFAQPIAQNAVFIRGVFYFLLKYGGVGSYDLATGELNIHSFSTSGFLSVYKFFELDGDLMLAYKQQVTYNMCIKKYDRSHKVWVPLQSLGGRSLFISKHSVYVDTINRYGMLSANKVFILIEKTCCVYSLEENGELLECTSARLRNWDGLDYYPGYSLWVDPPDVLMKLGDTLLHRR